MQCFDKNITVLACWPNDISFNQSKLNQSDHMCMKNAIISVCNFFFDMSVEGRSCDTQSRQMNIPRVRAPDDTEFFAG